MNVLYTNIWIGGKGGSHTTAELAQFCAESIKRNHPSKYWRRVEMRVGGHWFRPPVSLLTANLRHTYSMTEQLQEDMLYDLYDWAKEQYQEFGFISDYSLKPNGPIRIT